MKATGQDFTPEQRAARQAALAQGSSPSSLATSPISAPPTGPIGRAQQQLSPTSSLSDPSFGLSSQGDARQTSFDVTSTTPAQAAAPTAQQAPTPLSSLHHANLVKQQGTAARDALEAQSNDLYQQLNSAIPKTTSAPAKSSVGYLAGKLVELGGRDELMSPAERMTLNALSPKLVSGSVVEPTYAALDTVRRQVAAGYKGRGIFADSDSHDLDRLYSALSQDQQRAVEAAGPQYGEMFSQAKGLVAQRKQLEDSLKATLGKDLSGSIGNTVGGAVKKLATGDFQAFDRTLSNIPDNLKSQAVLTGIGDAFSGGKGKGLRGWLFFISGHLAIFELTLQPCRKFSADKINPGPAVSALLQRPWERGITGAQSVHTGRGAP